VQDFIFLFELFTIMIGLSMAVMLKGFTDILRLRFRRKAGITKTDSDIKVGWLLPLLGLFMLFNIASFWLLIHPLREVLPFNYASIIVIIVLIGSYYILASLVFPSEPELWVNLDDYYWQTKRFILLGALFLMIIGNIGVSVLDINIDIPPEHIARYSAFYWMRLLILLSIPLLLWAGLSKSRNVNFFFLIYYTVLNLCYMVVTAITPPYVEGMAL